MPKDGFLAPKAIANRMKAKGLQMLRWYCQMCQKQCRDENGFKCHTMSESHLRQMEMFSENSTKFMDEFSREFEQGMIEIIKRKARSQRKNANELYRDYISDKQHFHMNATIWETLTDFVMYLGRKGMCEVDETEKGWFVMYIDRDPETLARMEARAKRERDALDSEEKHQRDIQRQVKQARLAGELDDELAQPTELQRAHDAERIRIGGLGAALASTGKAKLAVVPSVFGEDEPDGASAEAGSSSEGGSRKPMSSAEQLMREERARKERADARAQAEASAEAERRAVAAAEEEAAAVAAAASSSGARRLDYWLAVGLVVKCTDKRLQGGAYYKQKGSVEKLVDRYTAHVRMTISGDLLKLDQEVLETVIPAAGGRVLVVNGAWRGQIGSLVAIDEARFCVRVQLDSGQLLEAVEYEDVCKLALSA